MIPSSDQPPSADFETIYARHSREVWALVYARWLNADVAQDVMQEAFLRFWKQMQEGGLIQNPRAWLLRVARNLAEDQAKSAFRRNGTQAPQTMDTLHARSPVPLDSLVQEETFGRLRDELNLLSTADREILTLRYAFDYSAQEIADVLDIHSTAVHMRLSRARQRLSERLTAKGVTQD